MHHLLPPEKYFHWRAGEITRLEAFCDVVFGFAITLLVVSLEVPHSFEELMHVMRGFLPFAACFAQFVLIWITHYRFSRRYGLEDAYTVFLNVVLLFLVLFYVYPLKFLFTHLLGGFVGMESMESISPPDISLLMRVYGMGFAAVFALFALMYLHAYKLRGKLELNPVECLVTRTSLQENIALMLFGLVSFFVAFRYPGLSGSLYMGIGIVFWVHGSIMGKRVRLLADKIADEARKAADTAEVAVEN
jgi:uncharacterized membrane protein